MAVGGEGTAGKETGGRKGVRRCSRRVVGVCEGIDFKCVKTRLRPVKTLNVNVTGESKWV